MLKGKPSAFSHKWLKILFVEGKENLYIKWVLSKKNIPRSVIRNRLKRWTRDCLRKKMIKGQVVIIMLKRDKNFYKKLRRESFDNVFKTVFEAAPYKDKEN